MVAETGQARRPTSFDVAKRAGVSRATVSHILNGQGSRFPEETRNRVLNAASELKYQPSPAGRALVTGRSDVIVVVMPNTTFGSNLQDLVDEVTRLAGLHGLSVVVRFAGRNPAETLAAVMNFRPVAVVNFGGLSKEDQITLAASGAATIPSALRDDDASGKDPNFLIGQRMAEELLRDGPRPLVFAALLDERTDPFGPARYAGLKAVTDARGLPQPARIEVPLDIIGATLALDAVSGEGRSIGVACYNDHVAIAVLAAGRTLGLATPEDLAVIGVDASEVGQLVSPRLTTIALDNGALLRKIAADLEAVTKNKPPNQTPDAGREFLTVIQGETS